VIDLMLAAPGVPVLLWGAHQVRPVLRPLALRARPLPRPATTIMVAAAIAGIAGLALWRRATR
jgi:hypothetical protein